MYRKKGWIPSPRTTYSKALFSELKRHFSFELYRKINLYCSLGTPLDFWHGIDGFIELEKSIVTLDLTTREDKMSVKADILISETIFTNPEQFVSKVVELAELLKIRNDHQILAYE